jgi:inner membrane protein YhjD
VDEPGAEARAQPAAAEPKGPLAAFNRFQQRHRPLAVPFAVVKKFGDDQAGGLAALIAYYGFFSLFPLLLAFTTVLGIVLKHNPSAQRSVEKSVVGSFPIIGHQIQLHSLSGSVASLVVGLVLALMAGLGVTQASQNALARVWAVPYRDRPNFLRSRLRGLMLLAALGAIFVISTGASGAVSGGLGGPLAKVAGYAVAVVLNLALFFTAFALMTPKSVRRRDLWPGALLAAVVWTILQSFGGYYIGHVLKKQSDAGATFGLVIALLIWLHLGAQVTLYAAELNSVLSRRLWPRSLAGPPRTRADRATLTALAKVEERSTAEHVGVDFDG